MPIPNSKLKWESFFSPFLLELFLSWLKNGIAKIRVDWRKNVAFILTVGNFPYTDFLHKCAKTAKIVSVLNEIPCTEELRLAEWRGQQEPGFKPGPYESHV